MPEDSNQDVEKYRKKYYDALVLEKKLEREFEDATAERIVFEAALYTAMKNAAVLSFKGNEETFTRGIDLYSSFVDKVKGYAWLKEEGFGDMITETVNAQTFSAHIRSMIKTDTEFEVPDFVKATPKERIRFRKKGGW